MPPPKRRTRGGRTLSGTAGSPRIAPAHGSAATDHTRRAERIATSRPKRRRPPSSVAARAATPTHRTQSRRVHHRHRPNWHRWLGLSLLLAGVSVLILNDVMLLQPSAVLLPGGHNELYLFAAVAISGFSAWFFGWFDRSA